MDLHFLDLDLLEVSIIDDKKYPAYLGTSIEMRDEKVNLIVAQRAYELNSKAITTADSMLETANNLKR